jgi:metallo-beta-lactamase class B
MEAAQQSAGAEWGGVVDYLCTTELVTPNRPDHPLIEPVQIFDNLYAIGRSSTIVYAITTSDGIILIDSGYGDQIDSVLLPGMAQLGLDPADVELVFLAHGHGDHYGGATHLQARFGASVVASAADWDLMEDAASRPSAVPPPTRDVVARDGQPITLGDGVVTPYLVPGHTPGAIGMVFPVHDGENTYTAALFGGMALELWRLSDEALPQYLSSVERFSRLSAELGFEVVVQNHPLFGGMPEKLERLKTRRAGEAHPFVIQEGSYQRFMQTISECSQAQIAAARGGD